MVQTGSLVETTMKNSLSTKNFHSYSDSYQNWVNGIKQFSSSLTEKKWKQSLTTIRQKNGNLKISSLNIERFDPTLQIINQIDMNYNSSLNGVKSLNKYDAEIEEMIKNPFSDQNYENSQELATKTIDLKTIVYKEDGLLKRNNSTLNSPVKVVNNLYSKRFSRIPSLKKTISTIKSQTIDGKNKIILSNNKKDDINKSRSASTSNLSLNNEGKNSEKEKNISGKFVGKDHFKTTKKGGITRKNTDILYNKIFDKRLKIKLNMNAEPDLNEENKPNLKYINGKIRKIKDKIYMMKGVFDYVYPKVVLKKAEVITSSFKKTKNEFLQVNNINQIFDNYSMVENPFKIENFSKSIIKSKKMLDSKLSVRHTASHSMKKRDVKNDAMDIVVNPIKIIHFN